MRNILLFILTISLIACNNDKYQATNHLKNVKVLYESKNYLSSAKEIELAKKLDSINPEIIYWNAYIKYKTLSYDHSIKLFTSLVRNNYKVDTCFKMIGENYISIGIGYEYQEDDTINARFAYQNAISYFDSAISKNNQYFQAYKGKIRGLNNINMLEDAISVINNAVLMFGDSTPILLWRGIEKQGLGDNFGGFNDLTNAIKSNKLDSEDIATAYRFRSFIYSSKGSIDKAIDDLTIAISYNPADQFLYFIRGYLYKDKNLKDKACIDFRKAGDLGFTVIYKEIRNYCEINVPTKQNK